MQLHHYNQSMRWLLKKQTLMKENQSGDRLVKWTRRVNFTFYKCMYLVQCLCKCTCFALVYCAIETFQAFVSPLFTQQIATSKTMATGYELSESHPFVLLSIYLSTASREPQFIFILVSSNFIWAVNMLHWQHYHECKIYKSL